MRLTIGVVGSRETYFEDPALAKQNMFKTLEKYKYITRIVSGACPLGGVDSWAREYCSTHPIEFTEFPAKDNSSEEFHARNQLIVDASDGLIIFLTKKWGLTAGTKSTFYKAVKKGIPIKIFFVE
jgi:hypothetical protein